MSDMPDTQLPPPFEAYAGTEPFIFVSYCHQDSEGVFLDSARLHQDGYRIWYDEGIDPGSEWPEEVAKALADATVFLVFISPNAVASRNVRNEINYALNHKKAFVAVHLFETPLPPGLELRMGDIQALLRYRTAEAFYWRKLTKALPAGVHAGALNHSVNPVRPSRPQSVRYDCPITPSALSKLAAIVQSGPQEEVDAMIRGLGLDRSPVAKKAASRFIDWMERYHHPDYGTVGEPIHSWLTADRGADQVAENWSLFLKTVACVLVSPELRRGLKVTHRDGDVEPLGLPQTDDWLPFVEERLFLEAVAENRRRKEMR
jgi:hypothetical protein